MKFIDHEFNGGYRSFQGCYSGALCNGVGTTGNLSLEFGTGFGNPFWSANIPYTPSSHGKCL